MHFTKTFSLAALATAANVYPTPNSPQTPSTLAIHELFTFPAPTWIENMAVRPTGELILTLLTEPKLYQIDPTNSPADTAPTLVYTFPPHLRPAGISVTTPSSDTFVVATAEFTSDHVPVAGTWAVWTVNMTTFSTSGSPPIVTKLVDVPDAKWLNGITHLYPVTNPSVLIADSGLGAVWVLDTLNPADIHVLLDDPLMKPAETGVGINGLHLFNGTDLYFSNTDQSLVAIIPIESVNGSGTHPLGPATVLAHTLVPDDFSLHNVVGDVYVDAGQAGKLQFINRTSGIVETVASDSRLRGVTASKFGNRAGDKEVLYVCTNGGLGDSTSEVPVAGGRVLAVEVD